MALSCFTACGNSSNGDTENTQQNNPTGNDPEDTEVLPEIIPASNYKPREIAVNYMYEMSQIKWTPTETMDYTEEIHKSLLYKKGVEYTGIIYATGNQTLTNADKFRSKLNENGQYIGPIDRLGAFGNHCSSSIRLAYDQISNNMKFTWTGAMVPSRKLGTIPLGDYVVEDTDTTTNEICERTPATKMYECYALLQPGDSILTCWGDTGHARMIVKVDMQKNAAGKINPTRSTVTTIEQTSSFDESRTDGVRTTWYVEHVYSFAKLYETCYIPLTIPEFSREVTDTVFTVKGLNNEQNVTEGTLYGVIESSCLEIMSITVQYIDADGNVVAEKDYPLRGSNRNEFMFSSLKAPDGSTNLSAGKYTFEVTANTMFGSAKLYKLPFEVK